MEKTSAKDEIHLLDYLLVLARRSRLIVFATLGIMVLTYLYLLLIVPKQYTAAIRIIPPQQSITLSGQLLEGLGLTSLPGSTVGLGGMAAGLLGKNPNDIYVGMLTSNTILDRIIARFNLRELYDQKFIEDVRKKLVNRTTIEPEQEGLIVLDVTDIDPVKAAAMANAFAEELDKLLQEIATRDAENQLVFLEEQRRQSMTNLTQAEDELRSFSEKSGVIQLDAQARGMIDYVATLRAEIDAKEVQIQVLRKQATPFNFDVVRLETEVNSLRDKLREAERQVDQTCLGNICLETSKVPGLEVQYLRLFREVRYQETLYQTLCKLVELARLDAAKNVSVARIKFVDRALPPEKKSKPQRVLTSLVVGTITFFFLIIYVFIREYWEVQAKDADNTARIAELRSYLQSWLRPVRKIGSLMRKKS
jgi:tyrosine-protein kinase Etk/Wzc